MTLWRNKVSWRFIEDLPSLEVALSTCETCCALHHPRPPLARTHLHRRQRQRVPPAAIARFQRAQKD